MVLIFDRECRIMSRPASSSAALPVAYIVLRILIVVNWFMGAAILALLVVMPNEQWIMAAFKLSPSPDAERVIMGLRAVAVLGLVAVPLNYVVLKRLLAIVETVRAGDPFVAANASRLQAIAGALLALQLLSIVIGAIGKAISTPAHPVHLNAGFSINGWLAVLLTFLLARVFAEGTLMREDLDGTGATRRRATGSGEQTERKPMNALLNAHGRAARANPREGFRTSLGGCSSWSSGCTERWCSPNGDRGTSSCSSGPSLRRASPSST